MAQGDKTTCTERTAIVADRWAQGARAPTPGGAPSTRARRIHPWLPALLILSGSVPAPVAADPASAASPPIHLSGTHTFSGQYATRRGMGQETPAEFWREDLTLLCALYGVPLQVQGTLSSLQSPNRQDVNRIQVSLDLRSLARRRLTGALGILRRFRTLEAGACRPRYSPLVLDGLPVTGANVELELGALYLACAAGRGDKAITSAGAAAPTFRQDVLFGSIGYGRRERTHLHLSLLHVREPSPADTTTTAEVSSTITPHESFVAGLSGRLLLAGGRWVTDGELAMALITRDLDTPALDAGTWDVPSWLEELLDPRASSSADWAYGLRSAFQAGGTQLSGGLTLLGPGYQSLGAPNLRGDRLAYDAAVRQAFWGSRVQADLFLRRQHDNRVDWKAATTVAQGYGIGATVRPRRDTHVRLQYLPSSQETSGDSADVNSEARVVGVLVGHDRPLWGSRLSSQLNYCLYTGETDAPTDEQSYATHTASMSEVLSFPSAFSVHLMIGLRSSDLPGARGELWSAALGAAHKPVPWARVSLGGDWAEDPAGQRTGIDGGLALRLGPWGDLDLRALERFHSKTGDTTDNDAAEEDEFILRGSLTTTW